MMLTSEGGLLGGRLAYEQPVGGFRTGLEPVLLAAAVPARAGERVLEAGVGAGAGLLCLCARVAGVVPVGVEREAAMAWLARRNLAANGFEATIVTSALHQVGEAAIGGAVDHAMANPPWHETAGSASPDRLRDAAKRAEPALLAVWTLALSRLLRPRGSLCLVLPAGQFAVAAGAMREAGLGGVSLFPLWARAGAAPRLILLRGVKGSRAADGIRPGLVLHEEGGGFSPEAQEILRGGAAIAW